MTQEELDALMNGGDLENLEALEAKEEAKEDAKEGTKEEPKEGKENSSYNEKMTVKKEDAEKYGKISPMNGLPLPPLKSIKSCIN